MLRVMVVVVLGSHCSGAFWWWQHLISVEPKIQVRLGVFALNRFPAVSEFPTNNKTLSKGRAILVLMSLDNWFLILKVVRFLIVKHSAETFLRLVLSFLFGR